MTTASYFSTSAMLFLSQLVELLAEVPGHLLEDVAHHAVQRRRRRGLLGGDRVAHLGLDLLGEAPVVGLGEPAARQEEGAGAQQRVLARAPVGGDRFVAVARGVVR